MITNTINGLKPACSESDEIINKWKIGATYTFEYKRARNPQFHRLVFAVANIVCSNSDKWTNPLLFIKAVELTYGYAETLMNTKGEVFQVPKSISFENMTEDEFKEIYSCLLIEASRITGVDIETLKQEAQND